MSDAPLIPVSWPANAFWRIQRAYERVIRAYGPDDHEPRIPPKRGQKPNYVLIPLLNVPDVQVATARGGAPRKLTESDMQRLRRMVKDQPGLWTLKMLVERFPKVKSTRTIRRALTELGLKLKKKRPARRA